MINVQCTMFTITMEIANPNHSLHLTSKIHFTAIYRM